MGTEKTPTVRVCVEVESNVIVPDFHPEGEKREPCSRYFVGVNLREDQLQLTGEAFVQVVREALKSEVFRGNLVLVVQDGSPKKTRECQRAGRAEKIEELRITDRWQKPEACRTNPFKPANQQH